VANNLLAAAIDTRVCPLVMYPFLNPKPWTLNYKPFILNAIPLSLSLKYEWLILNPEP
jgi:hypothetical protein